MNNRFKLTQTKQANIQRMTKINDELHDDDDDIAAVDYTDTGN